MASESGAGMAAIAGPGRSHELVRLGRWGPARAMRASAPIGPTMPPRHVAPEGARAEASALPTLAEEADGQVHGRRRRCCDYPSNLLSFPAMISPQTIIIPV